MSVVLPDKQNVAALKASKNLIGPIYAIIKSDRSGRIVSGENRASADSTWPAQIRHFENNFEEELFRIEANTQRQVPEAEQKLRFNHLAEACVNDLHFAPEKVCGFLVEKLKERYTQRWIEHLLDARYKAKTVPKTTGKVEVTSTSNLVKEKASQLKEGLNSLQSSAVPALEGSPVMEGCLCPQCPNRQRCGIL